MKKKLAVITGGEGGIARAIKDELLSCEIYEVLTPSKNDLNVKDVESVSSYFSERYVDVLINNAGQIFIDTISNDSIDKHQDVILTNISGAFFCANAVLKRNLKAKIINIGSSAGTKVHACWSSYCATKAALIMATKCWAEEGFDAICLSPGRTLTKMRKKMYPNEDESTLMRVEDFAKIVKFAILGRYQIGANIDVNVDNVRKLINDQKNYNS